MVGDNECSGLEVILSERKMIYRTCFRCPKNVRARRDFRDHLLLLHSNYISERRTNFTDKVTQRFSVTVEARPEKCSIDMDRGQRRNQFKIKHKFWTKGGLNSFSIIGAFLLCPSKCSSNLQTMQRNIQVNHSNKLFCLFYYVLFFYLSLSTLFKF